jgi:expansin (peptidoglycan-binding protein)
MSFAYCWFLPPLHTKARSGWARQALLLDPTQSDGEIAKLTDCPRRHVNLIRHELEKAGAIIRYRSKRPVRRVRAYHRYGDPRAAER